MRKMKVFFLFVITVSMCMNAQGFTVTSPKAGDGWQTGKHYTITWEGDCPGTTVKINIFKNSISQANFVEQLNGPNNGSMGWTIPDSYTTGNYILRVKDENNCNGDSGVFKIENIRFNPISDTRIPSGEIPKIVKPDLKFESMTVEPMPGSQTARLMLKAVIKNGGKSRVGKSKTRLTITGTKAEKNYLFEIPQIEANGTYDYMLDFNGEPAVPGGKINVSMILDSRHVIMELHEDNNSRSVQYAPTIGPDLTAYIRSIPSVNIGVERTITFEVRNIGNAPAPATRVKTYITDKGTRFYNVDALPPGGKWEHTRKVKWHKKGTKTVSAEADRDHLISSEPRGNNLIVRKVKVTTFGNFVPEGILPPPNLVGRIDVLAPQGFYTGKNIRVTITVSNRGEYKVETFPVVLNSIDHDGKLMQWDSLLPGESRSETFWYKYRSPGEKALQLVINNDLAGQLTKMFHIMLPPQ